MRLSDIPLPIIGILKSHGLIWRGDGDFRTHCGKFWGTHSRNDNGVVCRSRRVAVDRFYMYQVYSRRMVVRHTYGVRDSRGDSCRCWSIPSRLQKTTLSAASSTSLIELSECELQVIESGFESRTFRRGTHDSHLHLNAGNEVSLANRSEVFSVERA